MRSDTTRSPHTSFFVLLLLALGWMGPVITRAQRPSASSSAQGSIKGSVALPDGAPVSEAVKVTLKVLRGDQAMVYTDQQGRFELKGLGAGEYTVEVDADRDPRFEVVTERVTVQRNAPTFVTIYLKEKKSNVQAVSGKTVSVASFDQKVPAAARREFEKATKLAGQGRLNESIDALNRAIAIYPEYLMARNDLGAQLLDQGRLKEAEEQLRAAIKIDPDSFNAQLNLGIVLTKLNRFLEAIVPLDKALTIQPASPAAHLYAGIASVATNDSQRAERELGIAFDLGGTPYAVALVHLGRLYMKNGEPDKARKVFEKYLRESPDGANAAQVQKLIAILH